MVDASCVNVVFLGVFLLFLKTSRGANSESSTLNTPKVPTGHNMLLGFTHISILYPYNLTNFGFTDVSLPFLQNMIAYGSMICSPLLLLKY